MQSTEQRPRILVLGMGGTIAGRSASAHDNVGYVAGVAPLEELVAGAVPQGTSIESESVAQIDSKDLDWATWRRLAQRIAHHAQRPEVAGIVVTHGTDTLEETAYALHRTHASPKPVVITGAMRPASSVQADGPQNLRDAITVAADARAHGVLVAFAGRVHAGAMVRKVHPYRLDAFSSGDAGAVALVEEGAVRWLHEARADDAPLSLDAVVAGPWPWIEIITSAAGAEPRAVDALVAAGVQGIVVAATGNGTLHRAMEAALVRAMQAGVPVLRATRCGDGRIVPSTGAPAVPSADALTPVQARIELALRRLAARA